MILAILPEIGLLVLAVIVMALDLIWRSERTAPAGLDHRGRSWW